MADSSATAERDRLAKERAERVQANAASAIALIDSLANKRGDIGLSFGRSAKYLPQYHEDRYPPFFVSNGLATASGESINRVVKAQEQRTGQKIDEVRWGTNSVIQRDQAGNFPKTQFNIFVAENQPLLAKAAYQTIYDGRTENGRARQFLLHHGELLHNLVRQPAPDGQGIQSVEKTGLAALSVRKDSTNYEAFVKADDLKKAVQANPGAAKYLAVALEEASQRYKESREVTRAKSSGMER